MKTQLFFLAGLSGTTWRAALGYVALTVLLAFPLSIHPAGSVLSDAPDTNLFIWTLSWDAHALTHQPLAPFDANIFFPRRHTLAYSENLLGSSVIAAPVIWVSRNAVLAMNLVALASTVLCGLGAFVLARRLGMSAAAAFAAGLVFAFAPSRFLRLDQIHLATVQWIPFSLAYCHAYLDDGRPRDLRLAIGFFVLQALTSGHGAVFAAVSLAALAVFRLVCGDALAPLRRLKDVGVTGALLVVPVALVAMPYFAAQRDVGLKRTLDNWSVPAASFLASPTHADALLLGLASAQWINDAAGAYLFVGFVPLLFALCAFVIPRRVDSPRRDARIFYVVLALLALWLSAGPPIGLWPAVYWLPGMNFIRVPSRFMILFVLPIAVLAGFGIDRLLARVRPAWRGGVAAVCAVLLLAEFVVLPLGLTPYAVDVPRIDRWLASRPKPFAIVELPLPNPSHAGAFERQQTLFMLHATAHWQKTVNGYSGFTPTEHAALYSELAEFPTRRGIDALSSLGVDYVVVHADLYEPGDWSRVERALAALEPRLHLVHVEGQGRVYALHR